jgi:hypothetical protein
MFRRRRRYRVRPRSTDYIVEEQGFFGGWSALELFGMYLIYDSLTTAEAAVENIDIKGIDNVSREDVGYVPDTAIESAAIPEDIAVMEESVPTEVAHIENVSSPEEDTTSIEDTTPVDTTSYEDTSSNDSWGYDSDSSSSYDSGGSSYD